MNETKPRKSVLNLARVWYAFRYSVAGLRAACRHEAAFTQELVLAAVLVPVAVALPASSLQTALLIGCVLLVLIVELLNSAVEAVVDRVSTERDDLARRAKDMGSAAVFLALVNCAVVWALVLLDLFV